MAHRLPAGLRQHQSMGGLSEVSLDDGLAGVEHALGGLDSAYVLFKGQGACRWAVNAAPTASRRLAHCPRSCVRHAASDIPRPLVSPPSPLLCPALQPTGVATAGGALAL